MAATKTRPKTKKDSSPTHEEGEMNASESLPVKSGKPIETDDHEPVVTIEEKPEEDPLAAPSEDDEESGDIGIDSDELNPFGDRWEE